MSTPEEEAKLVTKQAAKKSDQHDPRKRQIATVSGEPGHDKYGLTFEKGPGKDRIVAVVFDQ